MTWRERVQEVASFRGVAFFVSGRTRSGGRRGADHEFPGRDVPESQDTGRQQRGWQVQGYVLGEGYMDARDRLVEALERPGPGTYVDPWDGEWTVTVRGWELSESTGEGGIARFRIELRETGEQIFPSAALDTGAALRAGADAAAEAVLRAFRQGFRVDGLPGYVAADAEALAADLGRAVRRLGRMVRRLDPADYPDAPDPARALAVFERDLSANVRDGLGSAVHGLMGAFGAGAYRPRVGGGRGGDPDGAGALFAELGEFGSLEAGPATQAGTRSRAMANRAALVLLTRRLAVTEEARALSASRFDSYDSAIARRDALGARIDAVMVAAGGGPLGGLAPRMDDRVFAAMRELRTLVAADVAGRAGRLPRVRRVEARRMEPAFVSAHRIYGDGARALELTARNPGITHPGFVPPGLVLEVLEDAAG